MNERHRLLTSDQVFAEFKRFCEIEEAFLTRWKADQRCQHVATLTETQLPSCKCIRKALEHLPEIHDISELLREDLEMDIAGFFYDLRRNQ